MAEISLNSWSPSNDPTRIPEVRHNIRLITDACKSDFDGLAREAKSLDEKKKWVIREDARLRKNVEEEAERELYLIYSKFYSRQNSYRTFTASAARQC